MMSRLSPLSFCLLIASSAWMVEGFLPQHCSIPSASTANQPSCPIDSLQMSSENNGEVGKGENWLEKSFPVDTDEKVSTKKVDDYNLGISGRDYQTGPLGKRMFETIV